MKAICIVDEEAGAALSLREVDTPRPGPDELLVRVRASGVNFADLYRATKHFGADGKADMAIAGLEMAGEVVEAGAQVVGFGPGDRVMALSSSTYAEYCVVNAAHAIAVPREVSWIDAAAIPATFITAHDALITNGEMKPGETVLIQAASSGVGIAAIQLARHLGAGKIIGTSTSDEKLEKLRALGLAHGINSKKTDFVTVVNEITGGAGADVIIDNIGGDTLSGDVDAAAVKGRIINVGRLGKWVGEMDLDEHSRKRLKVIGVTFRTRSIDEHGDVASKAAVAILPALKSGAIKPLVDRVFPMEDALAAQEYMKSARHFGKIVLDIASEQES